MKNDVKSGNTAGRNQSTLEDSDGSTDLNRLSNKDLLSKCKEYGRQALEWKWKFAGLLPEVSRRGLWKEAGFASVFHFSKVLAGMSEAQVKQALRLERKFENMPRLQELFHEGKVSPNKLDRIGALCTEENEEELAQMVQMHSRRAVDTLVRDVQMHALSGQSMTWPHSETIANGTEEERTTLHYPAGDIAATPGSAARLGRDEKRAACKQESFCTHNGEDMDRLGLSPEVQARLLKLKEKGFDINDLLMELLDAREEMIEEEKNEIADEIEEKEELEHEMWQGCPPRTWYGLSESGKAHEKLTVQRNGGNGGSKGGRCSGRSRYVNARTKRVIQAEHGSKCSIEMCKKPAAELHHTRRFALAPNNNPRFLAPLCKAHHELAARVDVRYLGYRKK